MLRSGEPHSASFRDPAGFVFLDDGVYKRAITVDGESDYRLLMESGLHKRLVSQGFLLSHEEEIIDDAAENIRHVLVPEQLPFISYPYEWCFEQLKDAALLTLRIQREALNLGLSLKDASFFNVQFHRGKPAFIDTSSFEEDGDRPWVAYRQYCEHFLSPLLLMAHVAPDFNRYLATSLDGFSLSLTRRLLPWRVKWNPGVFMHVSLHARSQEKHAQGEPSRQHAPVKMSRQRKTALVESLLSTVEGVQLGRQESEWSDYYENATHYSATAETFKHNVVARAVGEVMPKLVFDVGGNIGNYSRIVTAKGIDCVCYDQDPLCVNENYRRSRKTGDTHMLPLVMDLTNPTPALGFEGTERMAFGGRAEPDLVLGLALLHHLRITGNIPLRRLAAFFAQLSRHLLIEFVPRHDPLVKRLLAGRKDTFGDYDRDSFESCFGQHFEPAWQTDVPGTARTLYLFRRR